MAFISNLTRTILLFLSLIFLVSFALFPQNALTAYKPSLVANESSVSIHWTAPGDDMFLGQARLYDIRYSLTPVGTDTAAWWANADTVCCEPAPAPGGSPQSFTIRGLDSGMVYYIALKTADEAMNWSDISNIYRTRYSSCADVNANGVVNILDAVYLTYYLYLNGPPPPVTNNADINGDGYINLLDVSFLTVYLYMDGPDPVCL